MDDRVGHQVDLARQPPECQRRHPQHQMGRPATDGQLHDAVGEWTVRAMSYVDNIGKSRIRGLDVEGEFLTSSEWLMNFAYTHLDANVVNYESAGFVGYVGKTKANGKVLPQVPANSGSLGLACRGSSGCAWTTAAEEKSCLTE